MILLTVLNRKSLQVCKKKKKKKVLPSQIQTLNGVSTNIGWITQKVFADSEFDMHLMAVTDLVRSRPNYFNLSSFLVYILKSSFKF